MKRMKILSYAREDILGMSRIGYLNKEGNPKQKSKFELYIYTDDAGKIPHMHIHIDGEHDACIMFDKAEYFIYGKNNNTVDINTAKMIDKLLRQPFNSKITYWEYAIPMWNGNNSTMELPEDLEQPDYTKLNF